MNELSTYDDFFENFSGQVRRGLLSHFGIRPSIPIEQQVADFALEKSECLDRLRSDITALCSADSKAVDTVLGYERDLETSTFSAPYDLAGWLYLHRPALFDAAVELLEFDRGFNKPAMWSGFQVNAPFSTVGFDARTKHLQDAIGGCFATPKLKSPTVRILQFQRPSGRSDSMATIVTISVEGPTQSHRVFKARKGKKEPVTELFNPERGAAILIDDKARTIDIVATELGATIRKTLAKTILGRLRVGNAQLVKLHPREVDVDRLSKRFEFQVDPVRDGIVKVRLVGARMARASGGIVSLDAREADAEDAWLAWQSWGRSRGDSFGNAEMVGATLEFSFPDGATSVGERRRTLRMHKPFGLIMQHWPKDQQDRAKAVLQRWKFLREGAAVS